jgi:NifB/MoaA-like Fe-S oxidoreductase
VLWGGKSRTVVVLVNGGAESDEPVIALRPEDVEDLGIPLNSFDVIEVELASGKTHNLISRGKVKVELLDEQGNVLSYTYAYLVIDENLNEPLITDATIDELGIQVISFKKGLWRHVNDPPNTVRHSAHG